MVRRPTAAAAFAAFLSLGSATAQDTRHTPAPAIDLSPLDPEPTKAGRRFVDEVSAMIGEKAILASRLRTVVRDRVLGKLGAQERIVPSDLPLFRQEALAGEVEEQILAQSAKVSTAMTPDDLRALLDKELERYRAERIEESGSFSSYLENLKALGRNWETEAQERENEVLKSLSVSDLYRKAYTQASLWITPREVRRFYERNQALFVQSGSADVAMVLFRDVRDGKSAAERAAAAAELWAKSDLPAEEIGRRFLGTALPLRLGVQDTPKDPNAPFVRTFARTATAGQVSAPIPQNPGTADPAAGHWVLKAQQLRAGKNETFQDPRVQARIIAELINSRRIAMIRRLTARHQQNLYVWPPDLLDR